MYIKTPVYINKYISSRYSCPKKTEFCKQHQGAQRRGEIMAQHQKFQVIFEIALFAQCSPLFIFFTSLLVLYQSQLFPWQPVILDRHISSSTDLSAQ